MRRTLNKDERKRLTEAVRNGVVGGVKVTIRVRQECTTVGQCLFGQATITVLGHDVKVGVRSNRVRMRRAILQVFSPGEKLSLSSLRGKPGEAVDSLVDSAISQIRDAMDKAPTDGVGERVESARERARAALRAAQKGKSMERIMAELNGPLSGVSPEEWMEMWRTSCAGSVLAS